MILCEDRQQEIFARQYLTARGIHWSKIRANICPRGKQAGEQYVSDHYPIEVQAYRSKRHHLQIGLVVVVDADNHTIQQRLEVLAQRLREKSIPSRQIDEQIGIFIPKRNIETWIHYLRGNSVDEDKAYPKLKCESDCKPLVQDLVRRCHVGLDADAPPSLHEACAEIQRLLP
jgi:hypothetical protein